LMSAKKLMGSSVLCACISPRSYSPLNQQGLAQATPTPRDFFHGGNSSLQVDDQLCNSPEKFNYICYDIHIQFGPSFE
jgi:hypothetical protein